MRKECAHVVQFLCRNYLRVVPKNSSLWTQAYLYPSKTQKIIRPVHSIKLPFASVVSSLIPIFHTLYKEQKYITFNFLLLSTVENFS